MADTVTAKLGLVKPEVGASPDSWGNKTNNNWDKIDASMVRQTKQWTIEMGDDTVGSSAGPWKLTRYGNDELPIGDPITVNRQTGDVTLSGKLNVPAGLSAPLAMPYQAAPASPPAGTAVIYFDVNGNPVIKRPDGVVMHLGLAPGMITYTGASTPDAGCAFLDGQAISRVNNPVLFSRYGTFYGPGDGSTTFNLPDAKGSVFAHPDQGANRLTAAWLGVAPLLGNRGGSDSNLLTTTRIPAHYHTVGIADPQHVHGLGGSGTLGGSGNNGIQGGGTFSGCTSPSPISIALASTGLRGNSPNGMDTTYSEGGGQAHANVQSTLIMNAQIKLG